MAIAYTEVMATGEAIVTGVLMATGEAEVQSVQTTLDRGIIASRDRRFVGLLLCGIVASLADHLAIVHPC